ncbi:CDP-diacylglycerol--serine O-phosphatidyltransferase [bacterium F11]|nr:CDP-diacylglycerol--serine O-phosphatidyltransferase [bacterium F11]
MVPNLFTVGNMALGFFSIVASIQERWVEAASVIIVGHLFDILDGRVARWIGHTSRFGAEFDSFADWITFGLAPGIMVYLLFLKDFGKFGFLLAFFYVFTGALRLARFNVKSLKEEEGPNVNFMGLPIPGAGGFLAILVLLFVYFERGYQGKTMSLLYNHAPFVQQGIPVIVFVLALLMMSKIEYSTFKKTRFFYPKSLRAFLIMLFVCFMIYAYPQNTIFFLYIGYILWGILNATWRTYRLRKLANRS